MARAGPARDGSQIGSSSVIPGANRRQYVWRIDAGIKNDLRC
jgi:hypothetical protein